MRRVGLILGIALGAASCTKEGRPTAPPGSALVEVDGPGFLHAVEARSEPFVLVNVWATWCAPCVEEFPELVEVGKRWRALGVGLMFVSADFPEEREAALGFLQEQEATLPSFIKAGPDGQFIASVHPDWSGALPATVIFDRERERRYFKEGRVRARKLDEVLTGLVGRAPEGANTP